MTGRRSRAVPTRERLWVVVELSMVALRKERLAGDARPTNGGQLQSHLRSSAFICGLPEPLRFRRIPGLIADGQWASMTPEPVLPESSI